MTNVYHVIKRPLVTEKSTAMRDAGANVIAFEVDTRANKIQVKAAVEELFKVKVAEVRVFNVRGKVKRLGRNVGKRMAIILDNRVYSAPVIRERISGGHASITGNFSVD